MLRTLAKIVVMGKYSVLPLPADVLAQTASNHRQLRKQFGLTQAELARRSGISLGSLKRFEQSGQISYAALLKLAHVLNRLSEFSHLFEPGEDLRAVDALFDQPLPGDAGA